MIKVTHIKWSNKSIGVALHKLNYGKNTIKITAVGKDGKPYYTTPLVVDRGEIIKKYGVDVIQKNGMEGVWLPLKDFFQEKKEEPQLKLF